MSWVSRLWFCRRVLHDPPPQLVVRCGARTCIDGIVARFSAHGFLIVVIARVCSLTWKVVVMIFGHADRSAMQSV